MTFLREEQLLKAFCPIIETEGGRSILPRLLHSSKQFISRSVTVFGIFTEDILVQPEKAQPPTVVIPSPISTEPILSLIFPHGVRSGDSQ